MNQCCTRMMGKEGYGEGRKGWWFKADHIICQTCGVSVRSWACVTASGTGSLVYNDDVTVDISMKLCILLRFSAYCESNPTGNLSSTHNFYLTKGKTKGRKQMTEASEAQAAQGRIWWYAWVFVVCPFTFEPVKMKGLWEKMAVIGN